MMLLGRGHGRQPLMLGRGVDALVVQPDYESVAVEGPPFLAKVEEGLRQSEAGELIPHEEIKKQFLS